MEPNSTVFGSFVGSQTSFIDGYIQPRARLNGGVAYKGSWSPWSDASTLSNDYPYFDISMLSPYTRNPRPPSSKSSDSKSTCHSRGGSVDYVEMYSIRIFTGTVPSSHARHSQGIVQSQRLSVGTGRDQAREKGAPFIFPAPIAPLSLISTLGIHRDDAQFPQTQGAGKDSVIAKSTATHATQPHQPPNSNSCRYKAQLFHQDDEIILRTSRRTNMWPGTARLISSDSQIPEAGNNTHRTPTLSQTDSAIQAPAQEHSSLFSAAQNTRWRYTRDLVNDGFGDEVIPLPRQLSGGLPDLANNFASFSPQLQLPMPSHPWTSQRPKPFKKHPIPIPCHNPFRHPSGSRRSHENSPLAEVITYQHQTLNLLSIRRLEHLVDENQEIHLPIASRYTSETMLISTNGMGHKPSLSSPNYPRPPSGVMNGGFGDFVEERRRLSPQIKQSLTEPGRFEDFPICEMSIAMGLHEPPLYHVCRDTRSRYPGD